MNSECKKPILIHCNYCGYEFYSKTSKKGTTCSKCRKWITIPANASKQPANANIKDDIMQGNILDALEKADINPTNHREMFKDAIPLILKDEKLKFSFAQACQDRKRSPETIIRKAIRFWLKENGYI